MMPPGRSTPPDDLIARIAADMAPVRPAGPPARRVLLWLPPSLALFLVVPWYFGLRSDATSLGPLVTWAVSAGQVALGVWLLWAGTRESTPGRRLPMRLASAALLLTAAAIVSVTTLTFALSPTVMPGSLLPWDAGAFCFRGSLAVGAPMLFLAGWLLGRALPGQPWLAGALFGAGAGLTADASWRLVCPVSDPWHVLIGHGGAVVLLTAIGSAGAYGAARRRAGGTRARHAR